jgi:hypothetical protein
VEPPEELEDELQGPEDDELLLDGFPPDELLELDPPGVLLEELPSDPEEELRPLEEDGPPPPLLDEPVELLGGGGDPLLEDRRSDELLDGVLPLLVEEGVHDDPLEDIGPIFQVVKTEKTNLRIRGKIMLK